MHSDEFDVPQITIVSPSPDPRPSDETWIANESSLGTDNSSSTAVEPVVFNHKTDTEFTDVFERDGYTTTRTIIHFTSCRTSLSSLFCIPSSPVSASEVTSRPSSSIFANLNCMGSTDTFEEELDFILQQRENNLAGVSQEIKVRVSEERSVFYEEKWRDAIRAVLYESTPPVVSCVGHVH